MLQPMTPVSPICQVACDGFVVREFVQPPGLKIPKHAHQEATLVVVVSGAVADRFGSREIPLGPGQLLVRPVGEEHAHQYGAQGAHVVAFSFADTLFLEQRAVKRIQPGSLSIGTHVLLQELHAAEIERPLTLACRAAELVEDLVGVRAHERGIPGWLLRVRDALHDRCAWKPSLQQLAELAGVHQGHLTRAFRTHLHVSIGEYVRERRIERAERLLAEGRRAFAEIALDCGFFDQSHLIRAFRRARGMTPMRWLQMRGLSNRKPWRT
jgi:AraC family transcriptional regulator